MTIPSTIESLSATAASNNPTGSAQRTEADDGLRAAFAFIKQLKSLATLASATTVTPPSTANAFSVTGTTAITTIASTNSWDGRDIIFVFAGILTFTHGSNLILPGSANITTAAGDCAWLVQVASGQWRCIHYQKADGTLTSLTVSGALTVNGNTALGDAGTDTLTIKGNITSAAPTAGANLALTTTGAGANALSVVGDAAFTPFSITDGTRTVLVTTNATYGSLYGCTSNHGVGLLANNAVGLVLTNDGRLYGAALHNNAGAVTGTTNQYIASGTYTPTLTETTNITASTAAVCQWIRVRNVVTVSGQVNVTPTAASGWTMGVSLPIASNLASATQLAGSGTRDRTVGGSAAWVSIQGDATNNRATFDGGGDSNTDQAHFFTFTYLIV